jgi:hypothetical protein
MNFLSRFVAGGALLLPYVSAAQAPEDLRDLLDIFIDIIGIIVPIIFALIVLTISWGVAKAWIMGDSSSDDVEKGKKLVFVGVIVLAIMVSIWGIVRMLSTSFFG